jgi:hypothetical protein
MPKRHSKQRDHGSGQKRGKPQDTWRGPSVQTFFRFKLFDNRTRALIQSTIQTLYPRLQSRDGSKIALIRTADTVPAVLDLLPLATGIGEVIWDQQLSRFGDEAIPLILQRLRNIAAISDEHIRSLAYEKLIANLRWRGEAGAAALREVFASLDDYGGSLACVALGRLGDRNSIEAIWAFLEKVRWNDSKTFVVGPLWGLIDLDVQVGEALAELLADGQQFTELFGFLAKAGDAQAVVPLIQALLQQPKSNRYEVLAALSAIAHRIGREALSTQLTPAMADDPGQVAELADSLLARPADEAETYFGGMFQGPSAEDFAQSLAAVERR